MHRLKSQKNWATGENIGKERTWYQLKIAFLKDCLNLWRVRPLSRVRVTHSWLTPLLQGWKQGLLNAENLAIALLTIRFSYRTFTYP